MADDGVVTAKRTLPREKIQRDHPGSALPSVSGNAIKRITAGVKARAGSLCQDCAGGRAFTLPVDSLSNEKKNAHFHGFNGGPPYRLAGIKGLNGINRPEAHRSRISGAKRVYRS
jgi:hypothetical protein